LALAELGFKADEVDFLAVVDHEGGPVPAISLTVEDPQDPVWAVRAIKGLAVIGLAVTIVGLLMFEWRQAAVAADVEAALEQARQEIQGGVRTNPAARVLALKADASVLEIWDEISRILPDHTFVTELRMADGKVTLSGLSSDAARLVRIIDQSSLFSSATLAAAIVPDATEGKERFSIGFKVLGARAGRSSTHRPDGTAS
jgi:general secretion pathway protein L